MRLVWYICCSQVAPVPRSRELTPLETYTYISLHIMNSKAIEQWGFVIHFNPLAAPPCKGVIAWTELYHLLQK